MAKVYTQGLKTKLICKPFAPPLLFVNSRF